jgi:hypothetical protein
MAHYGGAEQGQLGRADIYEAPPPRLNIPGALAGQGENLARLAGMLSTLEEKLLPVLSNMKDPSNRIERPPSPQPINVLHQIEYHSEAIRLASAKLEDLLSRLEL